MVPRLPSSLSGAQALTHALQTPQESPNITAEADTLLNKRLGRYVHHARPCRMPCAREHWSMHTARGLSLPLAVPDTRQQTLMLQSLDANVSR